MAGNNNVQFNRLWMLTPTLIVQYADRTVGGKAFALAGLIHDGVPVPDFVVLRRMPESDQELGELLAWWEKAGRPDLVVRSSARAEDSASQSFAGQMQSFLAISSEEALKKALADCFASENRQASLAYQKHFGMFSDGMNVMVQRMVHPVISGVYFSRDPRGGATKGWLVEAVAGHNEGLVSGQVTPSQITAKTQQLPLAMSASTKEALLSFATKVEDFCQYPVDMEWAIDKTEKVWVLQARPITVLDDTASQQEEIKKEFKRIESKYEKDVVWDGQTFAEFTGFPSYLTFSIWKTAFSPSGSFNAALRKVGYLGFAGSDFTDKDTLLERVFGRAYINLNLMEKLFFGKVPYSIKTSPRTHLVFDWRKIDLETIYRTPISLFKMLQVSWNLQSNRRAMLKDCEAELGRFLLNVSSRPYKSEIYRDWHHADLLGELRLQADRFALQDMFWPFVLVMMTESTMQTLQTILQRKFSVQEAQNLLHQWMGQGIATLTSQMNVDYAEACASPRLRFSFLEKYGHRGPGEMDLAHPRWAELGERAFYLSSSSDKAIHVTEAKAQVEDSIRASIQGVQQSMVLAEWRYLKEMLELRERWKMGIMKTYTNLRWLSQELGRRNGLGDDIFWLRLTEILKGAHAKDAKLVAKISDRKSRFRAFKQISFPAIVSLSQLRETIGDTHESRKGDAIEGTAISSGLVSGRVRVVREIADAMPETWGADTILVAEATDPGWTPLFQRVVGIIVERGGVLSHCAIVAREMGLPAVSGIMNCTTRLKDGQLVWIDGFSGRVTIG